MADNPAPRERGDSSLVAYFVAPLGVMAFAYLIDVIFGAEFLIIPGSPARGIERFAVITVALSAVELIVAAVTLGGFFVFGTFGMWWLAVASLLGALSQLRPWSPDLIVTDLQMPVMTGLDLALALMEDARTAAIPLIMLGWFTSPAAFVLSGEMAVAYFVAHQPRGGWPVQNEGELAVLFCFAFLYVATVGGGPYSVDSRLRRQGRAHRAARSLGAP